MKRIIIAVLIFSFVPLIILAFAKFPFVTSDIMIVIGALCFGYLSWSIAGDLTKSRGL